MKSVAAEVAKGEFIDGGQCAGGSVNGENIQIIVTGGTADPDGELAREIGSDASHTQRKRTAHSWGERAVILINGERIDRQSWQALADVKELAGSVHGQDVSKVKIERGERRTRCSHQGSSGRIDLKY